MNNKSILALTILILFSSCASPQTLPTNQSPTAIEIAPLIPTDIPISATNTAIPNILIYTDPIAGFSIEYPTGWFIDASSLTHANESQNYVITISSWDVLKATTTLTKDNSVPKEETKIEIAVEKKDLTLEEVVAQQKEQITNGDSIHSEKLVTLEGGLQGMLWEVEGFAGPVRTLIVVLNGNTIYISGYGNLQVFDAIALTFRAQ